jgi:hypothetical protein
MSVYITLPWRRIANVSIRHGSRLKNDDEAPPTENKEEEEEEEEGWLST